MYLHFCQLLCQVVARQLSCPYLMCGGRRVGEGEERKRERGGGEGGKGELCCVLPNSSFQNAFIHFVRHM